MPRKIRNRQGSVRRDSRSSSHFFGFTIGADNELARWDRILEYFDVIPHHHLLSASAMTHELPFILTTLASFWLVLLTSAWMGATIMGHNRTIKDELVTRQEELIQADRAKTDFFRFVTHEVKSPVSTAQSAVETALELVDLIAGQVKVEVFVVGGERPALSTWERNTAAYHYAYLPVRRPFTPDEVSLLVEADGSGHSLARSAIRDDSLDPDNWSASPTIGGSPTRENVRSGVGRLSGCCTLADRYRYAW